MANIVIKFFWTKKSEASYRYARHTETYKGKKLVVTCPAPSGISKGDLKEILVQKLKDKRLTVDTPTLGADPNMTVNQLGDLFLKDAKDTCKPKTINERARILRAWILPEIGTMQVRNVKSRDIQPIIDKAQLNSPSTVEHVAKVVKRLFTFATENEYAIAVSPINAGLKKKVLGIIAAAKHGQTTEDDDIGLGIEDATLILKEVEGTDYEVVFHWMHFCGMRIGEALAITWADVDFVNDNVKVNNIVSDCTKNQLDGTQWADVIGPIVHSPKTKRGRREIPLQPQTRALLEQTPMDERHGYIYGTSNGTPVEPGNFRDRVFNKVRDALGMSWLTSKALRKFFGSFQIAQLGTDIITVSRWMGHSTPEVTMRVYAKLIREVETSHKFNMGRAFGA